MPKLGRRRCIRVGLEVAQGTALTPTVTAMLCYDPELQPTDSPIQREPARAYGGQATAQRGPAVGTCRVRTELRGNGTTGLEAGILAFLQAGGMKLTSLVLAPATVVADQKTLTVDSFEDGLQKRLHGLMCDWEISGEFGKPCYVEFNGQGLWDAPTDATLATTAPASGAAMRAVAVTLTVGGVTPKVSKFSVKYNAPLEPREDIAAAEGIAYYLIGPGRRPIITLDAEADTVAAWDVHGLWLAGTEGAFSLLLTDGVVNVTIAAPKCQILAPQAGQRGSKAIHNLQLQCNANAGDDELTITTAAHA